MQKGIVIVLIALWLGLGADAIHIALGPATGDGFTRGMNRVQGVGLRLLAGLVVGALAWWAGGRLAPGWLRQASRVPLAVTLAICLAIVLRVAVALIRGEG